MVQGEFIIFTDVEISRIIANKFESEDKINFPRSSVEKIILQCSLSKVAIVTRKDGFYNSDKWRNIQKNFMNSFGPNLRFNLNLEFKMDIKKLKDFKDLCKYKADKMNIEINLSVWTNCCELSLIKTLHPETEIELTITDDIFGDGFTDSSNLGFR